jgi:hypothetical protein
MPGTEPHPSDSRTPSRNGLRERLARWAAPQQEVHAQAERAAAARLGGTPIADLPLRRRATVCGTLRSVTLRPRAGVPALEAEMFDGSGSLSVVWLGRRAIPGVEPGRRVRVHGMVTDAHGHRVIFNPRYELLPRGSA